MPQTRIHSTQIGDGEVRLVDLSPEVQAVLNAKALSSSLAAVATSGLYADLLEKPATHNAYDQYFIVWGTPADSEFVYRLRTPRAFELMSTGHLVQAQSLATAETVFTVAKNGTPIGTVTFAAASGGGTTVIAQTSFVIGDVLTVQAPTSADSTLSDIDFSFVATLA